MAHFTPKITGDQAAFKAGAGVAMSSLVMKGVHHGLRVQKSPYIEIPVTIACICAADRFIN